VVRTDEAADAGRRVDASRGRKIEAEVARFNVDRAAGRGDERRARELANRQAKQQMLHRRVAANGDVEDVVFCSADRLGEVASERLNRQRRRGAQFVLGFRPGERMVEPGDDVGAPGDLRVLDPEARQPLAGRQIDEKADDVGRAEVDRQSQGDAPGRRDADDGRAANERARRKSVGAQDVGQRARGGKVDGADGGKRLEQPFEIAARVLERRLDDADVQGANRGRRGDVAEPILRVDFGARDGRERACRNLHLAVLARLHAASASPFLAAANERLAVEQGLAANEPHRARAAGATAATSADDANAVTARGVKERFILAAADFAIKIQERDAMSGRRRGRPGGHRSPPRAAGLARAAIVAARPVRRRQAAADAIDDRGRLVRRQVEPRGAIEADALGAGESEHRRLSLEREARIAGTQLARHGQAALPDHGEDQVLQSARGLHHHLIAERVERQRERGAPLGEQSGDVPADRRPEGAGAEGERGELARSGDEARGVKAFAPQAQDAVRRRVQRDDVEDAGGAS
jgi:hypothetical protein